MTIAYALRWRVVSIESFSTERVSSYKGKHFRCGIDTDGRRSFENAFVKKADMWLLITFL